MSEQEVLIEALKILANDVQSDDGVANAVIAQGAQEIEKLKKQLELVTNAFIKVCRDGCEIDGNISLQNYESEILGKIEKLNKELNNN